MTKAPDAGANATAATAATAASGAPARRARSGDRLAHGDRLGRYLIEEQLGAGGMGEVYAAFDPDLARRVALKVMRRGPASRTQRARLVREGQAQAQLSHRNVVMVLDVGAADDVLFVAMELIAGPTLGDWLGAQDRGWRQVIATFREAGRGLVAAHDAGLVHRDFKPDNVLLREDGTPCVADFGLARAAAASDEERADDSDGVDLGATDLVTTLTGTGALLDTPRYMAPEQHLGTRADERADQYSFCVALYEALYGRLPFRGDTQAELAAAKLREVIETPPSRSSTPRWLFRALRRGLRYEPDRRFPSMRELLEALDPARRTRRHRIAAACAIVAIGCASAIVWPRAGAATTEVVSLPTNSTKHIASRTILARGKRYRVRVSGTWHPTGEPTVVADAYYRTTGGASATWQWWPRVRLDGLVMAKIATRRGDPIDYASDHVYTTTVTGRDLPLYMHAADGNAADNEGTLRIEIEHIGDAAHGPSQDRDEVWVPADAEAPVFTRFRLEEGVDYELRISGAWSPWMGQIDGADAFYLYAEWRVNGVPELRPQLVIDGRSSADIARERGDSIEYRPSHVYTITLRGAGATLRLQMVDAAKGSWGDNFGGLRVRVRRLD